MTLLLNRKEMEDKAKAVRAALASLSKRSARESDRELHFLSAAIASLQEQLDAVYEKVWWLSGNEVVYLGPGYAAHMHLDVNEDVYPPEAETAITLQGVGGQTTQIFAFDRRSIEKLGHGFKALGELLLQRSVENKEQMKHAFHMQRVAEKRGGELRAIVTEARAAGDVGWGLLDKLEAIASALDDPYGHRADEEEG